MDGLVIVDNIVVVVRGNSGGMLCSIERRKMCC